MDLSEKFLFCDTFESHILDGLMLLTNLTISPRPGQNSNVADERRFGRC